MTANGVLQLVVFLVVLLALLKPLGGYMARIYDGRPCGPDRVFGWLERLIYRAARVRPGEEMGWETYAATMLLFNLAGLPAVLSRQEDRKLRDEDGVIGDPHPPAVILAATAIAVVTPAGRASISNPGPHGFSQVLYAFSSGTGDNGTAFAGLNANTAFYNVTVGLAMLVGRFWPATAVLAIAGSLAGKNTAPARAGTLPTHTPLFVVLLAGTVLLVGALTFIPALALGPIAEHLILVGTK